MIKRIDNSQFLSRLLQKTSDAIARQRGLPIVFGIMLVVVSLIVQSLNVFVSSQLLGLIGVVILHIGVLIALIGLAVTTPLGK